MQTHELMTRARTKEWDVHITYGGTDEDISGAQGIYFAARTTPTASTAVFQKSLGAGITITNGPQGRAHIVVDPADTEGLAAREYSLFYELVYKTAAGKKYRILDGRLTVSPNIADVP